MTYGDNVYNKYLKDKVVKEEQIKLLKEVGLGILKDFHNMCEKAGIKYSLALKSLLGAVKYHNFLPGDDIIRVFLKEEDYDKLGEIVSKEYPSKYVLMDNFVNKIYTNPNPRLVKLDTLLVDAAGDNRPYAMGIYIDIYLLRNAPDKDRAFREYRYKKYLQLAYQSCEFKYPSKILRERAEIYPQLKEYYNRRRSIGFFASFMPIKFWSWCRRKAIKSNKESKDYTICGKELRFVNKALFDEVELVDFADLKVYCVTKTDELFKQIYGDYLPLELDDLERLKVLIKLEDHTNQDK